MYQALYRKYRPGFFRDVTGQEHITSILLKEVAEKSFGHAYLFTGSRGTGKTTCARILAKAINCPNEKDGEPCGECSVCRGIDDGSLLDIIEMDAASTRSIDDIRQIREEVNFTPAIAKYKVYILDEVHMLMKDAANALLKTLEEPPEHVIFILATTEIHKLPDTIRSRCMRFDFKRISPEVIAERLKFVCKMEHMEIEDSAAVTIGRLADGGMRDALSLLDICRGGGEVITTEVVTRCAGLAGKEYLFELADKIALNDISGVLETVDELHNKSADVSRICDELMNHFRNLMVVSCTNGAKTVLKLLPGELLRTEKQAKAFSSEKIFYAISVLQDTLVKMARSTSKRIEFELALVKICTPSLSEGTDALLARIEKLENEVLMLKAGEAVLPKAPTFKAEEKPNEKPMEQKKQPKPQKEQGAQEPKGTVTEGDSDLLADWEDILNAIRNKNSMLGPLMEGSKGHLVGSRVLIEAPNEFFLDYMRKNDDFKEDIKTAIAQVTKVRYGIGPYEKQVKKSEDPLEALAKRAEELGIDKL